MGTILIWDATTTANVLIAVFTGLLVITAFLQNRGLKRANDHARLAADAAKAAAEHIPRVERAYLLLSLLAIVMLTARRDAPTVLGTATDLGSNQCCAFSHGGLWRS